MLRVLAACAILLSPELWAGVQKLQIKSVLDVAIVNGDPYYLTETGRVFRHSDAKLSQIELPERMVQLKTDGRTLYLLREDGSVWSYSKKGLRSVESRLPTLQLEVVGSTVYMLKRFGGLQSYRNGRLKMLLSGHKYELMAAGGNQLLLIDNWGRLFRYDTYAEFLEMVDPSQDNVQIVGAKGQAFVRKSNGRVYKYEDLAFHPLKHEGRIQTMATDGRWLWFVDAEHNLWELNLAVESIHRVDVCDRPELLRYSGDALYVGSTDGSFYRMQPSERRHRVQVNFQRLWSPPVHMMRDGFKRP